MKAIPLLLALLCAFTLSAKDKEKHKDTMALKDNLRVYWNMGQNPVLFPIHDQSGNGNHLTAYNNPTLVNGKLGKAIQFNGTNQYLEIASNSGFSHQGNPFTACIWFKPLALGNNKIIWGGGEWGANVVTSGANHYVSVAIEDETVIVSSVPLVVGQWYFLALGYREFDIADTSYVWASVNLSDRVTELQTGLTPIINPFRVAGTSAIGWLNCVIDDAAIFRRDVSAAELSRIYNDGDGLPFSEWDEAEACVAITCCD